MIQMIHFLGKKIRVKSTSRTRIFGYLDHWIIYQIFIYILLLYYLLLFIIYSNDPSNDPPGYCSLSVNRMLTVC